MTTDPDRLAFPAARQIELRGVRVHNLKNIDLDLPLQQLIVVTGVSGSGKSSLAFDTLYTEGQRRYIESFSTYARQFFDQLEKPDADRIASLPPAIAIRQNALSRGVRSTVATATEIHDYLRLVWSRLAELICPDCRVTVRQDTVEQSLDLVNGWPGERRFQVAFPIRGLTDFRERLLELGFQRVIIGHQTLRLDQLSDQQLEVAGSDPELPPLCVVDRLVAGQAESGRIRESLETAYRIGMGRWTMLIESSDAAATNAEDAQEGESAFRQVDGKLWRVLEFVGGYQCPRCERQFPRPEPRLFSFSSPLGACPTCQGAGSVASIRFSKLVPDDRVSLRDGAIAAWTTPAYRHELEELLELAGDFGIPVDVPFAELTDAHRDLILNGVPERQFGGLKGFFGWLERHRYKVGVRSVLNRWRSYAACADCAGTRLQPVARMARVAGLTLPEFCALPVGESRAFIASLPDQFAVDPLRGTEQARAELDARLSYLEEVGLGYLSLARPTRTLSGGEAQRVALTAALGSRLVNTLFVLDEPSAGLHPRDSRRVIDAVRRLCDRGNTVVVVEHEDLFLQAADWLVDIGPGAGRDGGCVVYSGRPDGLREVPESATREFYHSRHGLLPDDQPRREPRAWIEVNSIRRHNLDGISVRIPLGVLCVVTGVSGAGKSTLVSETLAVALERELGTAVPLDTEPWWQSLTGTSEIDGVQIVDQQPLARSSRSNPVTYVKAFDEIRKLFAETPEARLRKFTASDFSFNAANGGRCPRCRGQGQVDVDLHFLGELSMQCPDCHGTRFQHEILEVQYRGLSIADVLDLTVNEAFTVFRGHRKLLRRLQPLKDVGLGYLPLGQTTSTLSGGESQRLKLAGQLTTASGSRQLLILDEPTLGLHRADVASLLQCFAHLIDLGFSLLVIEHDLDVVAAADQVIELGPDAGAAGGRVTFAGIPEALADRHDSVTGRLLAARFAGQASDSAADSAAGATTSIGPDSDSDSVAVAVVDSDRGRRPLATGSVALQIVSGGQTGVDRAALDAALAGGFPCGGWCPAGRRAEDGTLPVAYPLRETPGTRYSQRTQWNVRDSDATLILARGELTGGTALTKTFAEQAGRPFLVVDLPEEAQRDHALVDHVLAWIESEQIGILNVAGPRESTQPGIQTQARKFLDRLLQRIHERHAGNR